MPLPAALVAAQLLTAQAIAPVVPADCYCTDTDGRRVDLRQTACLRIGQRRFTGLCEMSLNVPIWRDTGLPCAMSSLDPGLR